jgi:hypothetical protein
MSNRQETLVANVHAHAPRRAVALTLLACLPFAALAACSNSDDVATLGGGEGKGSASTQRVSAEKMADCLKDAKVPAIVQQEEGQDPAVSIDTTEAYMMCSGTGCMATGGEDTGSDSEFDRLQEAWDDMRGASDTPEGDDMAPFLAIGEQNHTEAFASCLTSTGYKEPEYKADPAEEAKEKQAQADAGAKWAACARENGFPAITDPEPPVVDNWKTAPMVLVPWSITEDQLKALLAKCPSFDTAGHKAQDEEMERAAQSGKDFNPDDFPWIADPPVSIDFPGMDKKTGMYNGELDKATETKLDKLNEILWAEQTAYYDAVSERVENQEG